MQTQYPPKGGVNKGQIIPLKSSCPFDCQCKSEEIRNWHHKSCSELCFVSQYGDIFCQHHLKICDGYLIQDASFECSSAGKGNTWKQYRGNSQFFMALVLCIKAAEISLDSNNELINFTTSLQKEAFQRRNQ
ncbi:unnamed protein product [Paramecium primaurelia]|uniref:Uncharacterized protein n=1 Tax=Paramecium primaurelia TaxID=5886 RepID=A0A8S1LZW9_PARPR|nr:unnamed protein product [Paramecium primaurelia]